jgi:hypothetical protein
VASDAREGGDDEPGPARDVEHGVVGSRPLASTRSASAFSSLMPGAVENGTAWRVN